MCKPTLERPCTFLSPALGRLLDLCVDKKRGRCVCVGGGGGMQPGAVPEWGWESRVPSVCLSPPPNTHTHTLTE